MVLSHFFGYLLPYFFIIKTKNNMKAIFKYRPEIDGLRTVAVLFSNFFPC